MRIATDQWISRLSMLLVTGILYGCSANASVRAEAEPRQIPAYHILSSPAANGMLLTLAVELPPQKTDEYMSALYAAWRNEAHARCGSLDPREPRETSFITEGDPLTTKLIRITIEG